MKDDFKKWNGEYEKRFYDVLTKTNEIIERCWPNAGKINSCDGSRRSWTIEAEIKIKESL